jgi:aminoglycoside 6'-N-acetyltransferase
MRADDLPDVVRWLAEPHVREWWRGRPADLVSVRAKYLPRIEGEEPTEMFVIAAGQRPIGMIQRYRVADYPDWADTLAAVLAAEPAAGIDYLIGEPDAVQRGYGSAAITAITAMIFEQWPDISAVVVGVQQANRPSWRALERADFRRVWAGQLDSDDPSDSGPAYVYLRSRPAGPGPGG